MKGFARIGTPEDVVRLQPYTMVWRWSFLKDKILLRAHLGQRVLDIQHIGSTAIPGMVAKPIIDISVAVADFETAAECIGPIERLGYEYQGENGSLRQYYFVKGQPTTHHLYVFEIDSETWVTRLAFRDYLIRHPDIARAYADLKGQLVQRFATDRKAYQEAKGVFIQQVLRVAMSDDQT